MSGIDAEQLASAVAAVVPTPLTGVFYRSVNINVLRAFSIDPNDGRHSGRTGGRYNWPDSGPTTYLAGSMTLAAAECEQESMVIGLGHVKPTPRLTYAVTVDRAMVLDLTNAVVLGQLGVDMESLMVGTLQWRKLNTQGVHTTPQRIGGAVRQGRPDIDGILYPSWFRKVLGGSLPRLDNLMLYMDPQNPRCPRNAQVVTTVHDPDNVLGALGVRGNEP